MKVVDRYIARLFVMNLAILFVVVVALVVLMGLIGNFDEFVQAAQAQAKIGSEGSVGWKTAWMVFDFYWPMVFLFAQYLIGLLPAAAAAFTLVSLNRHRELVAMLAGGMSLHRVAMPIIMTAFAANMLMVANQEWILPNLAGKLGRKTGDIKRGGKIRPFEVRLLSDSEGRLFTAASFHAETHDMREVTVLVRRPVGENRFGPATERITANQALWDETRGGWELIDGHRVTLDMKPEADAQGFAVRRPLPIDFMKSSLDPMAILMHQRAQFRQLLSLRQLNELIRHPPGVVSVAELKRIRHARFSLIVVNMLILVIGLAFFLVRSPRNMFGPAVKMAGLCVGGWGASIVALQMPPGLMAPAVVAWLPVVMLLPLSYWLMDGVET